MAFLAHLGDRCATGVPFLIHLPDFEAEKTITAGGIGVGDEELGGGLELRGPQPPEIKGSVGGKSIDLR